jgi:hypothetical protein
MNPTTYYHGSSAAYDFPSMELIQSATEDCGRAAKVVLGYYVTPKTDIAGGIGKNVYAIKLKEDAVIGKLPLREMIEAYEGVRELPWDEQVAFYKNERMKYLAQGIDMVDIIESAGWSGESFIVNLDAITSFERQ